MPSAARWSEAEKSAQYLSDSLDRRSMFQQQLHHFGSVLLAGDVKWSETILHTGRERKQKTQCEALGKG